MYVCVCVRINADIRGAKPTLILSNDAAGWSNTGPRDLWACHHDYVLQTTTAPKDTHLSHNGTTAYLNKRGDFKSFVADKTLFQGFTGCMDSLLNDRLSLYCVRVTKETGTLLEHEGARTAALIDDAVQAVVFDTGANPDGVQHAADEHYDRSFHVWAAMGAELDKTKTLFSDHAFIYLNRFHCEGTKVVTPGKVFAKTNREYTRRYLSIHDHVSSIVGAYRSAVARGADPLVSYLYALFCILSSASRHIRVCQAMEQSG